MQSESWCMSARQELFWGEPMKPSRVSSKAENTPTSEQGISSILSEYFIVLFATDRFFLCTASKLTIVSLIGGEDSAGKLFGMPVVRSSSHLTRRKNEPSVATQHRRSWKIQITKHLTHFSSESILHKTVDMFCQLSFIF